MILRARGYTPANGKQKGRNGLGRRRFFAGNDTGIGHVNYFANTEFCLTVIKKTAKLLRRNSTAMLPVLAESNNARSVSVNIFSVFNPTVKAQLESSRALSSRAFRLLLTGLAIVMAFQGAHAQTNEWTWVSGNSEIPHCKAPAETCGIQGVYGTQGVPAPENTPGARTGSMSWIDKSGNIWLFGGSGYDANDANGELNDLWKFEPSSGEWTWISGNQAAGNYRGVFGSKGVPSSKNNPGARDGAEVWTDPSGRLWMFGGSAIDANGNAGRTNDLWEFDPDSAEWTWRSGDSALVHVGKKGYYGAVAVYGELGVPSPRNVPGGRVYSTTWTDSKGNLWMFGGLQWDFVTNISDDLNDLWKFDPITNEWTWMGGSDQGCQSSTYGTQGLPSAENTPGGRHGAAGWVDSGGDLWLYGGTSQDPRYSPNIQELNDLWKFDTETHEWAWMGGSNIQGNKCTYSGGGPGSNICGWAANSGERGAPSIESSPGGLDSASAWTDSYGRFWLFGGQGLDSAAKLGELNDLWEFDPRSMEWMWMGGSPRVWTSGIYGARNKPAANNQPGSRVSVTPAIGKDNHFWLFGGTGFDGGNKWGYLNDLWEYSVNRPSNQTLEFEGPTGPVEYGVKPISLSAKASSGLPVQFRVVSGPGKISGHELAITGAGTIVIAAIQPGTSGVAPTQEVKRGLTVAKAGLKVRAHDLYMAKGGKVPVLTYGFSGFVNGDTIKSATSGAPALTTTATSSSLPGTYPIKVSVGTFAASNYTITYVDGTLIVE